LTKVVVSLAWCAFWNISIAPVPLFAQCIKYFVTCQNSQNLFHDMTWDITEKKRYFKIILDSVKMIF